MQNRGQGYVGGGEVEVELLLLRGVVDVRHNVVNPEGTAAAARATAVAATAGAATPNHSNSHPSPAPQA